jgi:ATP-binding cassette subfamily C protein CydD
VTRPLDPRLLRHARAARRHVVLTAALGALTAGLVVAQALLLAEVIACSTHRSRRPARIRPAGDRSRWPGRCCAPRT